jgi:serine/threonine-protein kinase HipA
MRAAELLQLSVAEVSVESFATEHSLVVRRFDRVPVGVGFRRIHQEDLAQALAVPRLRKYEDDGGPGYRRILALLESIGDRDDSATSQEDFVKGLIYSWMVLNTDAHAKNYSLQLYPRREVLAPLYDVSSLIPCVNPIGATESELLETFGRTKLSMRIAASYEAAAALPTHLQTNTIGRYVDRIGTRARQVQEALAV